MFQPPLLSTSRITSIFVTILVTKLDTEMFSLKPKFNKFQLHEDALTFFRHCRPLRVPRPLPAAAPQSEGARPQLRSRDH